MRVTVASAIASLVDRNKRGFVDRPFIRDFVKDYMPSGSGFDAGVSVCFDKTNDTRLVFLTSFHHMNENGFYDGWTQHEVIVRPAFDGVDVRVGGVNKNAIKDHIHESFSFYLTQLVEMP